MTENPMETYTLRELSIIKLMSEGKTAEEISKELEISIHTVKTHKKNIMSKSGAKNSIHLIANCLREGII